MNELKELIEKEFLDKLLKEGVNVAKDFLNKIKRGLEELFQDKDFVKRIEVMYEDIDKQGKEKLDEINKNIDNGNGFSI